MINNHTLHCAKMYTKLFMLVIAFTLIDHSKSNDLYMIPYKIPGSYVLTQHAYGDAKTLIFEIWSGGSGSGESSSGGSGAYIKAIVTTIYKQSPLTFHIVVGKGGSKSPGGESSVTNNFSGLNLNVSGGGSSDSLFGSKGKVVSTNGTINHISIDGQDGIALRYDIYLGGTAPFGGIGGHIGTTAGTFRPNGTQPGGGAAYCSNICVGFGGDGMVIVQFISNFNPKNDSEFEHTKIYDELWDGKNDNNMFYDNNTFGLNIYQDPCKKITNNKYFRDYVNNHTECTGKWCIDGIFGNCGGSERNCYEVEHIIDKNGPEFNVSTSCKNIAGNIVMAWGKWNSALGGLASFDYKANINEKKIVYGRHMIEMVKLQIQRCDSRCIP